MRQDGFAKQLQQHFVQQADVHDGAVILLHQLFDGEGEARVLVAEHLRQLDLIVEQQPVLAPSGQRMQPEADLPKERLARLELAQLLAGEKAVSHQLVERVGAEMALRHPADGLNIAQAPGAGFDVGFQIVCGVEIAMMALGLFLDLRFEEILRGPEPVGRQRAAHAGEQRFRAGEQPRLEQGGGDADVGEALALAVVDGAHAVADLEADVPEKGQKFLDVRLPVRRVALRQQHHDVDVRTRVQLAAPVAAHGNQRQVVRKLAGVAHPGGAQGDVHQTRAVADQIFDGLVGREALLQKLRALIQNLAEDDGGELAAFEGLGCGRQIGPVGGMIEKLAVGVQEAAAAAGKSTLAPSVSTSKPWSVTKIVCSHCADSD